MVDNRRSQARRHPAPRPGGPPKNDTQPASRETRPWRQWHDSTQPAQTSPLEVSAPKRPQWGRFIYLAIILLIVAAIAKVAFDHVFWYNASGVVAGQQYTVSTIHSATVRKLLVQPSDHVQAGQVLATLSSPALQRKLTRDQARLAHLQHQEAADSSANKLASLRAKKQSLQAKAHSLNTRMKQQEQQLHSLRQLVARNAASGSDLAELRAKHAQMHAQYDQTQAQLQGVTSQLSNVKETASDQHADERIATLKKQHKNLQEKLDGLSLKAPVSGQVARINVSKGSVLSPGDKAIVLVSGEKRRAYLYFPPAAQDRLHKGQKVTVTGPDGARMHMRISSIYPSLQDAPIASRHKQFGSPRVVVSAKPVRGEQLPKGMHSGTPINSSVARWAAPVRWFDDLKDALSIR